MIRNYLWRTELKIFRSFWDLLPVKVALLFVLFVF